MISLSPFNGQNFHDHSITPLVLKESLKISLPSMILLKVGFPSKLSRYSSFVGTPYKHNHIWQNQRKISFKKKFSFEKCFDDKMDLRLFIFMWLYVYVHCHKNIMKINIQDSITTFEIFWCWQKWNHVKQVNNRLKWTIKTLDSFLIDTDYNQHNIK